MKLLILVVGVFAVAGLHVANASPITKEVATLGEEQTLVEDADEFVDAILAKLKEKAIEYGLDPMQLPDQLNGFSVTILFIRYHGELWFTNGWLQNLSTIVRAGEAEVSQVGRTLEIKTYVKFDRLFMTYAYRAKIMNIGPKGDVIGYVDDLLISTDILVDLDTCEAVLKKLFISDSGKLDVHLDGTWFFDEIWNVMIDMFTFVFKNVILNIIESKITETVELTLVGLDFGEVTGVVCGPGAVVPADHQIFNRH